MGRQTKIVLPKRGEVWLVTFDPTVGAEIQKTRPGLIIQNDVGNRYSQITIVSAITSKFRERLHPTEVLIHPPEGGMRTKSVVLLNQIRSMDKSRLVRRLGVVKPQTMALVDHALKISFGLVDL